MRNAVASRPPQRPSSPTNLSRAEALWRSGILSVPSTRVRVDVGGAPDSGTSGFGVRSSLSLRVTGAAEGVWIDFQGEAVLGVRLDGRDVPVEWDGSRVNLPRLEAGTHEVEVEARGRYSNSGQGLHRFHDPVDGATYLYTHFEPSDARRAWPCMDQPDLKTRFDLTVVHPTGWTVMGNGVVESERSGAVDGTTTTMLGTTLPLPTYLTALAAGPWHRVRAEWRSSRRPEDPALPISWSCRASLAEHLDDEPMAVTLAGLDLYDEHYDFPYPWGSYDCVLVPEYNIGAMENPGCVTFNEDSYLYRGPVTRAQRGTRANTILHEMCHMWFGDLVTPRWWEDTWLKESFADHQGTWAQAEATEYRRAWVEFASSRKDWAYLEDTRPATTHPIVATVDDVEAARQAFDGITYAKGAAVLKQLVAHLGQDVFTTAARDWFRSHAYGNGDLAEFLDTLSRASGRDMNAWADAWLRTSGPSILSDELDTDSGRITRLTLRQSGTDPTTGSTVLRPHTLAVGLYSFESATGALVRTHRLPVELTGESVEVEEAVGLPAPDLVTVNDEDLTYAVVRPDPASLATALTALGRLEDPMARALWWSCLYNLTRDGLLAPDSFVRAVVAQADDATDTATLATLSNQARLVALRYAPPAVRDSLVALLAGEPTGDAPAGADARGLLERAAPGSDVQLVRARAWIAAAGETLVLGPTAAERAARRLHDLLAGRVEGLVLSTDLRWRACTALARLGRLEGDELEAQRRRDDTASGAVDYLRACSSEPSGQLKEQVFARVLEDTALSNDALDALVEGFSVDSHRNLTAAFTTRYLAALRGVWQSRPQEIATRIVVGLFPAAGDSQDLRAVEAWLAESGDAPAALRTLVDKCRDDLARAVSVRNRGSVADVAHRDGMV